MADTFNKRSVKMADTVNKWSVKMIDTFNKRSVKKRLIGMFRKSN